MLSSRECLCVMSVSDKSTAQRCLDLGVLLIGVAAVFFVLLFFHIADSKLWFVLGGRLLVARLHWFAR